MDKKIHRPGSGRLSYVRKILSLFLLLLFIPKISYSQDFIQGPVSKKYLGIYLNPGLASFRDDLLVSLGFHGPALSLGGVYTYRSESNYFQIQLQIGLGYLKNRFSHEAWILTPNLRYSWVKKLVVHPQYGTFWGGICVPHQMVNLFFESWDDAHLYWLSAHGFGPALRWEKRISTKNQVIFRMEFPLFNWVSRPPTYRYNKQEPLNHWTYHFTEPNRSLHLQNLAEYHSLFMQLLFQRETGGSLLNIGIDFQYHYCRIPEEIWGYTTSLTISYQWRIGQ